MFDFEFDIELGMMTMEIRFHDEREFHRWAARLSSQDKAALLRSIQELEASRQPIPMPHGRRIEHDLYELRPAGSRSSIRAYYLRIGSIATFVAYGRKDTQQRDIERARRRTTR